MALELAPLYEVQTKDGDWVRLPSLKLHDELVVYDHKSATKTVAQVRALAFYGKMGDSLYIRQPKDLVYLILEINHIHLVQQALPATSDSDAVTGFVGVRSGQLDDSGRGTAIDMLAEDLVPVAIAAENVQIHHWDSLIYQVSLESQSGDAELSVLVRPCLADCKDNFDFACRGQPRAFFTGTRRV